MKRITAGTLSLLLVTVLGACAPSVGGGAPSTAAKDPALAAYNVAFLAVYSSTDGIRDPYGVIPVGRAELAPTGMRVLDGDVREISGVDPARALIFEGTVDGRLGLAYQITIDLVVSDWFGNVVFRTRRNAQDAFSPGPAVQAAVAAAVRDFVAVYPGFNASTKSRIQTQMDSWPRATASEREAVSILDSSAAALDPIEGIWVSDDNAYRLAILRDDSAPGSRFIATVLESDRFNWMPGMVKMEVRGTAIAGGYTADYFMGDFSRQGRSVLVSNGILEVQGLVDPYGNPVPAQFIRTYPTSTSAAGGSPSPSQESAAAVYTGSGFLISETGLVVTNAHVIEGTSNITVHVAEGNATFTAQVLLNDTNNDLAVLQLKDFDYGSVFNGPIPFGIGDSNTTAVGEDVLAVGFPLSGLLGSSLRVTDGIISAKAGVQDAPNVFQISNPLQPGNSGGPLFNMNGDVIGIVVASLDAGYVLGTSGALPQNVNFAVKSAYLRNLIQMLPAGADILQREPNSEMMTSGNLVAAVAPFIAFIEAQ